MAETPSTMLALGTQMPAFRLRDPAGKWVSSEDFKDAPGFLVAFICNHCPYVKHIRSHFAQLARTTRGREWPSSASVPTMRKRTPKIRPK